MADCLTIDDVDLKWPACKHIRGEHLVPGWGCCYCRTYNGYQRRECRACGHVACYETGSQPGEEASELASIGSNPILVRRWLEEKAKARRATS